MTTPTIFLIASLGLGQPPGLILPELAAPSLPAAFANAGLEQGLDGAEVAQACDYLGEGIPLCYRLIADGKKRWFSHAEAADWGIPLDQLSTAVDAEAAPNPLVHHKVEDGGEWWQVEAPDGHHSLIFLRPDWLEVVGPRPVVAAPAKGVVIAWNSGDSDNDQIMAVGARRIFDSHQAPITPLIFKRHEDRWAIWGEAKTPDAEAASPQAN